MKIGYHCSHEQFSPGELLDLVKAAEAAGFTAASSSDHFHPWSARQGQSGFAWSWLGSALEATSLPFGVVTAPGQRYHPAIIAQAAATLAQMYHDRLWVAMGSGELLNEGITGGVWPSKDIRNKRLLECVEVIRTLWTGGTVTHRGLVETVEAHLYTRPIRAPQLVGAAVTAETAEWVGSWADALVTVSRPPEELAKVVEAYRRGGGDGKPMFLKVQVSYDKTDEEALQGAWEQWRTNIFASAVLSDLRRPDDFDAAAAFVTAEDMRAYVRISSDVERQLDWLYQDAELGFDQIYLHNVNRRQQHFIDDFGRRVLPSLQRQEAQGG